MQVIDAKGLHFSALGARLRELRGQEVQIQNCLGHRYIGAGITDIKIDIQGVPGNALGAYLGAGSEIAVHGNAQDATGDTMSGGEIRIGGSAGDALGYGMRGGSIFVRGNAGYRAGIHMKEYGETRPQLVIGGRCGDFLGEYQAGGLIVVLGIGLPEGTAPVGRFCGTGMHGGRIFLRGFTRPAELPPQVSVHEADADDMDVIHPALERFALLFDADFERLVNDPYLVLTPNSNNPYRAMYVSS
ncbi:MAG: glutamate synthase [Oscillospiraceae bacterium]|jgi:glutamate synthase domain-containing protein 3|nr:glutamate synthase [Oscillospiraceae bacterium]